MTNSRVVLALVGILSACRPGTLSTDAGCSSEFLRKAAAFDTARAERLAGTYELILVGDNESARGYRARGELFVWVRDSTHRTRGMWGQLPRGRERILGAAFDREPSDTSARGRALASRDLDHPGGVYENGYFRLGDFDVLDGTGDDLHIERADSTGFRGRWRSDLGIGVLVDGRGGTLPNPAGHFCARRVTNARVK